MEFFVCSFAEEEYCVKVEYITVDFSLVDGLYDTIWGGLAGKEIGILGTLCQ